MYILLIKKKQSYMYSDLKKWFNLDLGLPSQVVLTSIINNKNALSIASKILFQIGAKLKKTLWKLQLPKLSSCMHIGI